MSLLHTIFRYKSLTPAFLILLFINGFLYFYLWKKIPYAPEQVPLWFTRPWGEMWLAEPEFLFTIPVLFTWIILVLFFVVYKYWFVNKQFVYPFIVLGFFALGYLSWVLYWISERFLFLAPPIFDYDFPPLILPFVISFALAYTITPFCVKLIEKIGAVDDPSKRDHPAMLITKATPRGGGVPFMIAFGLVSLVFLGVDREVLAIILAALFALIIALIDDKYDISPYIRLGVTLPVSALIIVGSGIGFTFFNNPFGGTVELGMPLIEFGIWGITAQILLSDVFTFFWVIWVANMINWSSGVDGQFSGVAGITLVVIALLSLRLVDHDPEQLKTALLACIAAGAVLGLAPHTWYPQKLMWGFSTTSVGIVIAALAVLTSAKVATAILVLLVPTLDAALVIARRLLQKRLPIWGDRAHLHHYLMDKRRWSIPQVAVFYWVITAVLGMVALLTAGRSKLLALLILGGVLAYALSFVHLGYLRDSRRHRHKKNSGST